MPRQVWAPLTLVPVTSTPSDAEEGSLWYRSDLDQVHASDGGPGPVVLAPAGNLPVVRPTGWHSVPAYGPVSTIIPTINRLYASPFWTGRSCTLTAAAVEVTVLAVGNVRAGIYSDNGGVPGTRLADFGTISTGLAGVKTWTPSPFSVRPILYWFTVVQQGLAATLRSRDTWDPIVSETSAVLSGNRNAYYVDGVSGALPASFGAVAGSAQSPSSLLQLT